MIAFEHVGKRYGGRFEALAHLNFRVARGEMVFLTGHSGAGKSSLLRLIMRLERPSRGRVLVAGHDLDQLHISQVPYYRRQIGVVFQDHQLLFDRDIFANVALPLTIQGVEPGDAAPELLDVQVTAFQVGTVYVGDFQFPAARRLQVSCYFNDIAAVDV